MFSRRHLLGSGLAAMGLAATGARAHETGAAATSLPPEMQPQLVQIPEGYEPGTIHVDPATFSLYWTLPDNTAIRYAVGIAREGLYEAGTFTIGAKKEWPSWTPTPDMIAREPELYAQWENGMPGGPDNPLGARALYLFQPERGDTFMRIHGTNAPHTIGSMVSNGCVRLINEHIVDLYDRVPEGATVTLYPLNYVG